MTILTKEETTALKSRIFGDFEHLPFDDKEITGKFIECLSLIGTDGEEVYSFFEECSQKCDFPSFKEEEFKNYYRICFWMSCLILIRYLEKPFNRKEEYITKIVEYILEKEMDELVKDIKKYIEENDQYEEICKFKPSIWLQKDRSNKFYPFELFKKIVQVIPEKYRDSFEYKPFEWPNFSKKKNEKPEKKEIIKNVLPQNILLQEMDDTYIINQMTEYGGAFLDKAVEEKNECVYKFMMRKISIPLWPGETEDEFIDYVLNVEIKKFGKDNENYFFSRSLYFLWEETIKEDTIIKNSFHKQKSHFYEEDFSNKVNKAFSHRDDLIERVLQVSLREYISSEGKTLENISKKIYLLKLIGTKKSFLKIWEVLGTRKCDIDLYEEIINKWTEHFPIKLLRKEIEDNNKGCILGVLHSKNEYAIRTLFALLYKNYNLAISERICINNNDPLEYTEYYKLLINLTIDDSYSGYFRSWYSPFHKKLLLDIVGIIKNDRIFGQKIKICLEKSNINLTNKLTFEQFNEIEKLQELSYEYKQTLPPRKFDINESIFPPRNEYEIKIDKILNKDKTPFTLSLWQEYHNEQHYIRAKFWLHEHKELDLHNFTFDTSYYNEFRNITLEKPFFFPEYSSKNENIMANYFYRELPFFDFVQQPEQRNVKTHILWKRYWQNLIEKSYESFKQKEFKSPLLPIIPEYAEYLLSRTDDMFSTAVENIPYYEYKTFLTENRKLQIKICIKNNTIQKEELDKLIALAEDYKTNYYAWPDEEIKDSLLSGTDLEKLNAILEPEFMVRVFEKSILWVIEHKDSELWLNAPWFGMQIFNKSYKDRPAIWAKHLIKIADKWNGSENMLRKICTALGHLREPLGNKVPKKLREIAENPQNENIKEDILIQLSLFNHENFKKMYHKGNEIKRIELCKKELIIGQNKEVKEKMQKE
jgi:hypothetical protein